MHKIIFWIIVRICVNIKVFKVHITHESDLTQITPNDLGRVFWGFKSNLTNMFKFLHVRVESWVFFFFFKLVDSWIQPIDSLQIEGAYLVNFTYFSAFFVLNFYRWGHNALVFKNVSSWTFVSIMIFFTHVKLWKSL